MFYKRILLLTAILTICIGLLGCGASANPGTTSESDVTAEGYYFTSNGFKIYVDMDIEEVKKAIGEPDSIFEEPSCAGQGMAYLYSYPGFEINTYPDGDVNRILYILLRDDTVGTTEGIDMSKSKDDIISVYGNGDEEGNKLIYRKNNMTLNFVLKDDVITEISYDSDVLN